MPLKSEHEGSLSMLLMWNIAPRPVTMPTQTVPGTLIMLR